MAVAAVGSAVGVSSAGRSALGVRAKKREEAPNMALFVMMPFSQTLYGLVVMAMAIFLFRDKFETWEAAVCIATGVFSGAGIGASAIWQGLVGARACDTVGETGLGTSEAIMFMGTIETCALFVMVMDIVGMFIAL